MKKLNIFLCVIIFIGHTFLFTACTNSEQNKAKNQATTDKKDVKQLNNLKKNRTKAVKGGELKIATTMPKTLNPLLNEDKETDQILRLIYDTLVLADENQRLMGNLAESWELQDQGASATVKLRTDVKWHDGVNFTAKDVIFSLDTIRQASETTMYKKNMVNIDSYKYIDDYTIKIFFNQPFSGSMYMLDFPIISEHYYQGESVFNSVKNNIPMGTGLYKLDNVVAQKEFNLKQNTAYFKGESYIEKIKVKLVLDKSVQEKMFLNKEIDIYFPEKTFDNSLIKNNFNLFTYNTFNYEFLGFNFSNEYLKDKNIRQAIAYGINKKQYIDNYYSYAVQADVPINPKSYLYNKSVNKYKFNLDLAKQMLKKSGFTDKNQNGILQKDNNVLKFNLLVNKENEQSMNMAYNIKKDLEQVGISINIQGVDFEEFKSKLQSKNFDIVLGGWNFSQVPDLTFMVHSSQIKNGENYISYKNSKMDNLLQQAFLATNENDLKMAYVELENYFSEELPYVSLFFKKGIVLTNKRLKADLKSTPEWLYFNIQNCYISE